MDRQFDTVFAKAETLATLPELEKYLMEFYGVLVLCMKRGYFVLETVEKVLNRCDILLYVRGSNHSFLPTNLSTYKLFTKYY